MDISQKIEPCLEYLSPIAIRNKLSQLGIPEKVLIKAAQQAFIEKANHQVFDPIGSGGYDAWRYAVRSVRKDLDHEGFRLDDPKNLPLSISDDFKINLTVSSGDVLTGTFGLLKQPKSKNIKGAMFLAAIDRNLGQDDLFPDTLPKNIANFEQTLSYPTWVFLIHITDEEIFAEFSLPNSMDLSGHIDGWAERIDIKVPFPDEESFESDDTNNEAIDIIPLVTDKKA